MADKIQSAAKRTPNTSADVKRTDDNALSATLPRENIAQFLVGLSRHVEAADLKYRKMLYRAVERCCEAAAALEKSRSEWKKLLGSAGWGTRTPPNEDEDRLRGVLKFVFPDNKRSSEYYSAVRPYIKKGLTPRKTIEAVKAVGGFRKAIEARQETPPVEIESGKEEAKEPEAADNKITIPNLDAIVLVADRKLEFPKVGQEAHVSLLGWLTRLDDRKYRIRVYDFVDVD